MSSNNQVIILKNNKNPLGNLKFEVHENICVDNDFEPDDETLIKRFNSFKKALIFAKKYCNEYPYVEYGYTIYDSCLEGMK